MFQNPSRDGLALLFPFLAILDKYLCQTSSERFQSKNRATLPPEPDVNAYHSLGVLGSIREASRLHFKKNRATTIGIAIALKPILTTNSNLIISTKIIIQVIVDSID